MNIEVAKIEKDVWQAHVVDIANFEGMGHRERDPGRAVTGLMAQMSVRLPNWPLEHLSQNIEITIKE